MSPWAPATITTGWTFVPGENATVVPELFLTPTAELAHVVLPAAGFAEIDGTFTDTERRVQRVRRAVPPPGECKPDWQIVCEISNRLGYPMHHQSAEEIFEELRRLMPNYGGITYKRIDENNGLQWPYPTEDHPGTKFLHKDKFTRGLGKLVGIEQEPPEEVPDAEYPSLKASSLCRFTIKTSRRISSPTMRSTPSGEQPK